ncbi:extracellular solute-binding protein [Promicromonospora soli]|uniref:Sulfate ABC transporter substrate-binding protein n=1 Tax=Promicromonospora soli TaxID=2035533 RepID=A0A919FK30_9MICO|nr:extracellular solute-binding protein [Promicromonospora soli]GHH67500.1 sulfate ABC transporter substrate-binding protein [Promicromonospora soli]
MKKLKPTAYLAAGTAALLMLTTACTSASAGGAGGDGEVINIVGFAVPEAANQAIAAKFQETEAGQGVTFSGSYGASGDQSRKVEAGADADYVHFSIEPDVTRLVDAGLVAEDWNAGPTNGIVSDSVVVLVVPEGNPKGIEDWDDLVGDDVKVITADPASSGAAKWNVLAAYSQAIAAGQSEEEAHEYLTQLFANVSQWAGSGREATEAFDKGVGDVLITYENEAILARQSGKAYDYIVPDNTFLIENPGTILEDATPAAKPWLDFVLSEEGQTEFVKKGFRPVIDGLSDVEVEGANDPADPFPTPANLGTVADLGGWSEINAKWFDDGALFSQLYDEATQK